LNIVLWTVFITLLVLINLAVIILPEPWAAVRLFSLFLLPVLVAFWLMRRGSVRPAIILFTASRWLGVVITELATPGGESSDNLSSYMLFMLVETIRQSSDTLLSLISDILDLSKIETQRLELEYRPF
jgi:signal transduction histidine kinase